MYIITSIAARPIRLDVVLLITVVLSFIIAVILYTVKLGCVEVHGTQSKLRLIWCFDTSVCSFDFRFT